MTKNIAHRGFSGAYPENTMLAFKKAVEAGCDGIEMDIHLTRDGELVIIHDESVDRTTDGRGSVRDLTLAELSTLDASADFMGGEYGENKIPTLAEYFDYARGLPIFTNIELKNSVHYYVGLEESVIELVRRYGLEERIIFSSFNNASVMKCKALAPEIKAGFLYAAPLTGAAAYVKYCGVEFFHPKYTQISERELRDCVEAGVGVNAWTVNAVKDMRYFIKMGAAGVISNFPNLCARVLRELQK